jgi:hemerythrin-like metal-binding protein
MLDWNEKLETGHAVIDSQNRMLIAYNNQVETLLGNSNPSNYEVELFLRCMDFLENYIITHFREESRMFCFQYPDHNDDVIGLFEFSDFFRGSKQRFETEGYSVEGIQELYDACVAWIQRHILRIDVQLKRNRPVKPYGFCGTSGSCTG